MIKNKKINIDCDTVFWIIDNTDPKTNMHMQIIKTTKLYFFPHGYVSLSKWSYWKKVHVNIAENN